MAVEAQELLNRFFLNKDINWVLHRSITTLIFDHFGVVGADPLAAWIENHKLGQNTLARLQEFCNLIAAGMYGIQYFAVSQLLEDLTKFNINIQTPTH